MCRFTGCSDHIEWHMFDVLHRMGVGDGFIKWICVLYANPSARILTNGLVSSPFRLHRGTQQGCPLSALLFTVAIEPLAMAIRTHTSIRGMEIGEVEHRISLYADDSFISLQFKANYSCTP